MSLTKKQKDVLDFIRKYQQQHDIAPTQAEIATHFGFRSLGHVQHFIRHLKQEGYLSGDRGARGLAARPISASQSHNQNPSAHALPFLGKVAAGNPIDYRLSSESFDVPLSFLDPKGEHFVLQAAGRSMMDAHILDGDYLIIKKQNHADNGQIVVCEVDHHATIKRYFKKRSGVELHPENPEYNIIHVLPDQDFRIEGILVGVLSRRM